MPMMGCIWSSSTARMLAFPVATMIRFCHNHGPQQAAAAALGAAGRRFAESGPGDRA
jgi:predicted NAD/FAD-binding protein